MKKTIQIISLIIVAGLTASFSFAGNTHSAKANNSHTNVWTQQQAIRWYASQPWLSGCNFQPSTAINQIEMWQAETFDAVTIDKELGWAEELGFNTMRVFLSSVVWKAEPVLFKKNIPFVK